MRTKASLNKLTKEKIIAIYLKQQKTVQDLTKINVGKKLMNGESEEKLRKKDLEIELFEELVDNLRKELEKEIKE